MGTCFRRSFSHRRLCNIRFRLLALDFSKRPACSHKTCLRKGWLTVYSATESTYHLKENPGLHPSILGANHQIHDEAAHVLYSSFNFDFATDIECVVPFLQDLTPLARASIKQISVLIRALPYTKDFDECEWASACTFIAKNIQLARLDLGIEGGKPIQRWDSHSAYTVADFQLMKETNFRGMEWITPLSAIKGLDVLNVKAYLEHRPPLHSSCAMAFFVDFSASIEHGFADYLRDLMMR